MATAGTAQGQATARVDAAAGTIKGILLRDRRGSALTALPDSIVGAKLNIDAIDANSRRSLRDRIGGVHRACLDPAGVVRIDVAINVKHALAEQLLWDAEHAPGGIMFQFDGKAAVNVVATGGNATAGGLYEDRTFSRGENPMANNLNALLGQTALRQQQVSAPPLSESLEDFARRHRGQLPTADVADSLASNQAAPQGHLAAGREPARRLAGGRRNGCRRHDRRREFDRLEAPALPRVTAPPLGLAVVDGGGGPGGFITIEPSTKGNVKMHELQIESWPWASSGTRERAEASNEAAAEVTRALLACEEETTRLAGLDPLKADPVEAEEAARKVRRRQHDLQARQIQALQDRLVILADLQRERAAADADAVSAIDIARHQVLLGLQKLGFGEYLASGDSVVMAQRKQLIDFAAPVAVALKRRVELRDAGTDLHDLVMQTKNEIRKLTEAMQARLAAALA